MLVSRAVFMAIRAKAAKKRSKRIDRIADNLALDVILAQTPDGKALAEAVGHPLPPKTSQDATRSVRKRKRGPSARKRALLRLAELCKTFVLLRCKWTNGSMCEVGVMCGGASPATLAYHIQPAATGNGVKYDDRNLVGACARCNGAEYFDRKRGTYERWTRRHREIQGDEVYELVKALAVRRPISTKEALEMGDEYTRRISMREWD